MKKLDLTPYQFDIRLVEWNLKHRIITKDQLQAYLDKLPDEEALTETIKFEDLADDLTTSFSNGGLFSVERQNL